MIGCLFELFGIIGTRAPEVPAFLVDGINNTVVLRDSTFDNITSMQPLISVETNAFLHEFLHLNETNFFRTSLAQSPSPPPEPFFNSSVRFLIEGCTFSQKVEGEFIRLVKSSAYINNCTFQNNFGREEIQLQGSSIYIKDSFFLDNRHLTASSISIKNNEIPSFMVIDGCKFSHNEDILNDGGGMTLQDGFTWIINTVFCERNYGRRGGSVFFTGSDVYRQPQLVINNTIFDSNQANNYGGAIHAEGTVDLWIDSSNFTNNAVPIGQGGAVSLDVSTIGTSVVNKCNFINNYAIKGDGAAIYTQSILCHKPAATPK